MKIIAILMLISVVGAIPFGSIETEKDPEEELQSFMEGKYLCSSCSIRILSAYPSASKLRK